MISFSSPEHFFLNKSCLLEASLLLQLPWLQCDQIGRYLKALSDKFCNKSSPNICQFLGYIEKHNILVKTAVEIVWASFEKLGLLFILPSGHTAMGDAQGTFEQPSPQASNKCVTKMKNSSGMTFQKCFESTV